MTCRATPYSVPAATPNPLSRKDLEWLVSGAAKSRQLKTEERFAELLTRHDRFAIVGGPNTGKSALAALATEHEVISSDEWLPGQKRHNPQLDWSAQSADMVRVCSALPRFVFEGVRAAHALRKGLVVDVVVCRWLELEPCTADQRAMAQGIKNKVFPEWLALNAGLVPVFEI